MRTTLLFATGLGGAIMILAVTAALSDDTVRQTRLRRQQAIDCAYLSEGTDQAIVDCFTRVDLECPQDLCSK